jgi:hypothetical protein
MQHELVACRIDVGDSVVVHRKVQAARGDDSALVLQWRAPHTEARFSDWCGTAASAVAGWP